MSKLDELLAESRDKEDFESSMGKVKPLTWHFGVIQIAQDQYREVQPTPAERLGDLIRSKLSQ